MVRSSRWASAICDVDRWMVVDVIEGRQGPDLDAWLARRPERWREGVEVTVTDLHEPFRQALRGLLAAGDPDGQVYEAWAVTEGLRDLYTLWAAAPDLARRWLDGLIDECRAGRSHEVRAMARTLVQWRHPILARHTTGHTNGPVEGLNSLIKKLTRAAAGIRSFTATDPSRLRRLQLDLPRHYEEFSPPSFVVGQIRGSPMLTIGSDNDMRGAGRLVVVGLASIGAGAIHATAAGNHSEHRQAVIAFVAVAVVQLSWGVLALVRAIPVLPWFGVVAQVAAIGGWALAKTSGIAFIDGLDEPEGPQFADTLAAGLALVAMVAIVASLSGWGAGLGSPLRRAVPQAGLTTAVAPVGVALVIPGMVAAGSHGHTGGAGGADDGHGDHAAPADDSDHAASEGRPFDPTMPIDLGGMPGVTPQQQAEAENLLAVTLLRLPQLADPALAEARGYHSIGDGVTGLEHFVNRDLERVAAMYMLERGSTIDDVPDFGGDLIQWHVHDNLCFTPDPAAPRVSSVTPAGQPCPGDTVRGSQVPMLHVWISPHRCGPFAALEGVAGGQVVGAGARLCDHAHGSGV
jgi:Transposase